MKIQIRSFIKGGNHGQYLQALGLRHFIKSVLPEAHVSHLDYNNHEGKEFRVQLKSLQLPKYLTMKSYWNKNLEYSGFNESDITIYGSDMIWHQESELFPGDPVFFGKNDSGIKLSYAPSVGYRGDNEPAWIKDRLNEFHWVGVRDKNTAEFVKDNSNKEPHYVIDPCFFLLGTPFLHGLEKVKKGNSISIYGDRKLLKLLKKGVPKKDYSELFSTHDYYGYFPRSKFFKNLKKQLQDPIQTVFGIAKSKLLLTSTFHGVMMALMSKTPFIAISSPNLDARLQSPISNSFDIKRLINRDQLSNLDYKNIQEYMDESDLDFNAMEEYLNESKKLISNQLVKLDSKDD